MLTVTLSNCVTTRTPRKAVFGVKSIDAGPIRQIYVVRFVHDATEHGVKAAQKALAQDGYCCHEELNIMAADEDGVWLTVRGIRNQPLSTFVNADIFADDIIRAARTEVLTFEQLADDRERMGLSATPVAEDGTCPACGHNPNDD